MAISASHFAKVKLKISFGSQTPKMDPSLDILSVKENIVRVEKTSLKDKQEDQYFSRLAELVGLALDDIASDCFETVIFSFTNLVEHNQSQMLLSLSLQCSRDLGLDICVVGPARLKEWIAEDEDPASIKFYETLMEASSPLNLSELN